MAGKTNQARRERIEKMRRSGMTYRSIASKEDIHPKTAWQYINGWYPVEQTEGHSNDQKSKT